MPPDRPQLVDVVGLFPTAFRLAADCCATDWLAVVSSGIQARQLADCPPKLVANQAALEELRRARGEALGNRARPMVTDAASLGGRCAAPGSASARTSSPWRSRLTAGGNQEEQDRSRGRRSTRDHADGGPAGKHACVCLGNLIMVSTLRSLKLG